MAVSTVPAAKAALISQLQAWPALSGVTVDWGGPTSETDMAREHIWLGRTRRSTEWAQLGAQRIHEEYTIDVMVQVVAKASRTSEQELEERLWALHSACEAAVRSDLSLGGVLGTCWADFDDAEQTNTPIPDGWVVKASLPVRCRARI